MGTADKITEKVKCRLCGAASRYQKIKGRFVYGGSARHKFLECSRCEAVYLYPLPSEEQERKFYRNEFEKYMANRSGADTRKGWLSAEDHIRTNRPEVERRMMFLKKLLNRRRKLNILEVGCSSGFLLFALRDMKHNVYGVEPSGVFTDFLRTKNVTLFTDASDAARSGIKFDLILHYYVLEHIRKPAEFIQGYMDLLSGSGKMVFEVPNVQDPLISLYSVPSFGRFYWSMAHHWYFSPESMTYMLDKLGHKYSFYLEQRYDLSNHMVWMQDGKPGGKGRYSDVFTRELEDAYKQSLIKSGFCDTLGVVLENKTVLI
ncbi:MAG: class I SAM-dependent methyltransferase [Thermodesulfovibrionia bacterium]|nr:class I SAM-dependent methyltransferase [Thermodesulfovibrionia bacterium]